MRKLVLLASLLALYAVNAMAQIPQITQIFPAPNTTAAVSSANITITWNTALSSASVNANNIKVWGSQTGLLTNASITLSTSGTVVTIDPANNFKAGEQIYVRVGTAIQSTTNIAVAASQNWSFIVAAQGDGSFGPSANFPLVEQPITGVAAGDTDGDGDLDIVSSIMDPAISLLVAVNNNGILSDTMLSSSPASSFTIFSTLADFDNDGDLDAASGSIFAYSETKFYENGGSNTFSLNYSNSASTSSPLFPSLLNDDDNFDVLVSGYIFQGDGAVSFSRVGLPSFTYSIPGDVDGDLDNDIVGTINDDIRVYSNDGLGNFSLAASLGLSNIAGTGLRLADMDGDGDLDIIASNDDGITIYSNNGNGTSFTTHALSSVSESSIAFEIADFNGDSRPDIAYILDEAVYTANNNGNFSFATPTQIGCNYSSTTVQLATADVNGDSKVDIVVASQFFDVKIYLNSFSAPVLSTTSITFPPTLVDSTVTTTASFSFDTLPGNVLFMSDPENFTLSLDNNTFGSTATITSGSTSPRTIYIRFSPSAITDYDSYIVSNLGCAYRIILSGEGTVGDGMVVNTLNDGPGSLRYALENATSGTVITFAGGLGNTFTITGEPIVIHHPLNIDFRNLSDSGEIIINSGSFPAIRFDCGSVGTVLTGVSVISSHPSGGVISTCPDVQPGKFQNKQNMDN